MLCHYGDYTQYDLETASEIMFKAVKKANKNVHHQGSIIAPLEGDVIRF